MKLSNLLQVILLLAIGNTAAQQGIYYGNRCYITDEPVEDREAMVPIVFSGRVLSVHKNTHNSTYFCSIFIYRVMKGQSNMTSLLDLPSETTTFYSKTVEVSGFGNEHICDSDVEVGDTKIFLVSYHRSTNLTLNSSLVRVGVRSLRKTLAG